jgi:hypothetical protein
MISRRSFLISLGGIVTSAFVACAKTHVLHTGQPLLIRPARTEEMLYLYEGFNDDGSEEAYRYRASLGLDEWPAPEPPTWREHLRAQGPTFTTPCDFERLTRERDLSPEDLDGPIDEHTWETYWEHDGSPQARAYKLLKELQLDCDPNAVAGR